MFNPYMTTYGTLLSIAPLKAALIRYINIVNLDELEFEYPSSGDVKYIFITGYSDEEKELPVWEHPLVLKTIKGISVVISDVRKFVTKTNELPARLEDVVKDKNSLDFIITRTMITADFVEGSLGKFRGIYNPSTTAMGIWISGMIGAITPLDPLEAFNVEIIASVYANSLYYEQKDIKDNIDTIIARVITAKHSYKFNKKEIRALADSYTITDKGLLETLLYNISNVLPEEKHQFITIDNVIGIMGNIWYGPGSSETPIMALENMPTWLALLNAVINNRSYAKSRIGTLLGKHSRVIDSKVLSKFFTNYTAEVVVK